MTAGVYLPKKSASDQVLENGEVIRGIAEVEVLEGFRTKIWHLDLESAVTLNLGQTMNKKPSFLNNVKEEDLKILLVQLT